MKILLLNQPLGNRGDESAHKAFVRKLVTTFPDINFRLIVTVSNRLNQISDFRVEASNMEYLNPTMLRGIDKVISFAYDCGLSILLNFHPSVRYIYNVIKDSDLVVCMPGGICMGGFQNWNHISMLMIAKMLHKPIAYYGRSIGPFPVTTAKNRKFKKYSFELLNYFNYISLRDKKSEEIAVKGSLKFISTVDTAFLDTPSAEIPMRIQNILGDYKYLVVVPNSLTWHYYYSKTSQNVIDNFYILLMKSILETYPEHKIVMLPQLHNFAVDDDKYYFTRLAEKIANTRIVVIDDMYGSDLQQAVISNADCVIGARYHSIVFAINQGVPFISLSYEHKMTGLLETLNVENRMIDISEIFGSDDYVYKAVARIMNLIPQAIKESSKSITWKKQAKNIAVNSFNEFEKFVKTLM